jgi:hypothetical protein
MKMRQIKQPVLYVLTVSKPNSKELPLKLNMLNYDAAWDADTAMRHEGFNVSWERHGYAVCRDAADAVASAKFWLN